MVRTAKYEHPQLISDHSSFLTTPVADGSVYLLGSVWNLPATFVPYYRLCCVVMVTASVSSNDYVWP